MSIRVVKTDDTLTPGMFLDGMDIFDLIVSQSSCEAIKIIFFKVNFRIVASKGKVA